MAPDRTLRRPPSLLWVSSPGYRDVLRTRAPQPVQARSTSRRARACVARRQSNEGGREATPGSGGVGGFLASLHVRAVGRPVDDFSRICGRAPTPKIPGKLITSCGASARRLATREQVVCFYEAFASSQLGHGFRGIELDSLMRLCRVGEWVCHVCCIRQSPSIAALGGSGLVIGVWWIRCRIRGKVVVGLKPCSFCHVCRIASVA